MLSVRMLGVLSVYVDGQRISEDLGPSGRSLLAYLSEFNGSVHRRERLADLFWGHLDPERARAALNTALWRLRRLMAQDPLSEGGRNLQSTGFEVLLEPAPWLDIDTHRFGATVKNALNGAAQANNDERQAELEGAVAVYSGPFLEGDDADWILEERERLHSLFVRASTELIRCYAHTECYEEAIWTARRVLAVDPFRESMHRDLLLLLVLNGQRGEALRHHERWSALFREELEISPMPQTLRLAEDVRSGVIFEQLDQLKSQRFQQSMARRK